MSTSPSWFDQEKFSRLVKKVGPKNVSEAHAAPAAPTPASPATPTPAPIAAPAAPAPTPSAAVQPPPASPAASQSLPAPSASQPLPKTDLSPAHANGPETGDVAAPAENPATTARISLVSKPPSLLNENRALPALPRRTTPLPGLKSLFQSPAPGDTTTESGSLPTPPPLQAPPAIVQPPAIQPPPLPDTAAAVEGPFAKSGTVVKVDPFARAEPPTKPEPAAKIEPITRTEMPALSDAAPFLPKPDSSLADEEDDLSGIWQKMALLNEELAQTIQERDHANNDINLLREQLREADEEVEKSKSLVTPDEMSQVARERDAAVAELEALKLKASASDSQKIVLPDGVTKTKELVFLTSERDQARKEYAELRKQFEMLKRDQTGSIPNVREDSNKFRKELEQQLEGFRVKLEEKNREIAELRSNPTFGSAAPAASNGAGSENEEKFKAELNSLTSEMGALKAEIATLKEQAQKAKEDASIAQRGLALSQKALQETRDTLREATEGSSLSRHNFDNLKNECATLTQQNSILQAQNDQLSRELASAKQRQSGRLA